MAPANRMAMSDTRKIATIGLVIVGVFVLFCGVGMSSVAVGSIGVVLAVGGPILIFATTLRGNVRSYVFGTARVVEISPPPTVGPSGRGELGLVIHARGIDGVAVRVRDPAIPLNKWPQVGATLPVRSVSGSPRKTIVLWADVRTHEEATYDDRINPEYADLSDEERGPGAAGDDEFDHGPLPPDDTPTMADIPPVLTSAPPSGDGSGGTGERSASVPVAQRRRPSPRPRKPVHDEAEDIAARYLVGELPGRVRADAELSLIVSITSESPEPGLPAASLPALNPGPEGVQITAIVRPDANLVALGELQQIITVPQHGDGEPVRFAFRARAVGLARLRVTAWSGGTFLAELRLEVSIEARTPAPEGQRRSAVIGDLHGDPGEVTLQVNLEGSRYSFQLLSQNLMSGPVVAKSLAAEPDKAVERTIAMLRSMAGDASGYEPALAARWVQETGTGLWRDLVPQSIQDQFWQLRGNITSFTIACNHDTVPWELLYPLRPGDDAGFLVEQFPVLRRVYDQARSHRVLLGQGRYVVPPGSPRNADDEVAKVRRILQQPDSAPVANLGELLDLLDAGSLGLLHFACHNSFSVEAGGSSIKMGGGAFVPQLLNRAVARRCLAATSPLIFVNACRSAGVVPEYTRMMGWAEQFMAAGAGAFIGTLWPVRSNSASAYAEAFYGALVAGRELGQATFEARLAAKRDADPTWLAYTTYGDPAAIGTLER